MTAPRRVPQREGGGSTGPKLVLARHGQTDANVTRTLDSRPPGWPLNSTGVAQAELLADSLTDQRVLAVYASVAPRARQTAAPIAARHGLDVTVVENVHEVLVGDLEGRSDEHARTLFEEVYTSWWTGQLHRSLPGGESALDLRNRFLPVAQRLWDNHHGADGVVVLVSHGAAIRLAAGAMIGEYADTRYVPNAGRVVLEAAPEQPTGWRLLSWDDGAPIPGDVTGGAAGA